MTSTTLDDIRALFPVTQNCIYLNNAGIAPISTRVGDVMREFIAQVERSGWTASKEFVRAANQVRALAAQLLNCAPEEIAFTKNTAEGLNYVAHGIDWRPGDSLVTVDVEYPTNVYPWMNLEKRGVVIRWLRERDGYIPVEEIARAIDGSTRLVALSHVEFASGFRNDLEKVGEICRAHNVLFVVDAMQSLGVIPIDVRKAKVDVLASGAWKWLAGPVGIGIFYCSRPAMEKIGVAFVGAESVINAEDYLNYDFTLKPDARRFEYGALDYCAILGMGAAMKLALELGVEKIKNRVKGLTDLLCLGLKAKGYPVFSPRAENQWSGIVSAQTPGRSPNEIETILRGKNIVTAVRAGRLRISPNYYNSESDIEAVLNALP